MAGERSAKYRQEIQQSCYEMVYDVRKAKGKPPPHSTIVRETRDYLEDAPSSSTQQSLSNISTLMSPTVTASQSSGESSTMTGFNKHLGHSTRSVNSRSKIVVLKSGGALRSLGRTISVLSVCGVPGSKVITVQAPSEQLSTFNEQKPRLHALSAQAVLDGNGVERAMVKPPDGECRQSAISVSEAGSPLRRRNEHSIINSDLEQLANDSKQEFETTSNFQAPLDDAYETPSMPFSLSQGKPPPTFHRRLNLSSNRQRLSLSALNRQLNSSPPSWRKRQLQLLEELGLSADKQWQESSSQLNQRTWDPRGGWPTGPTPLEDLGRPLWPSYAPLAYNITPSQAPSFLPATMSTAFVAEGWNQMPDTGIYGVATAALMPPNPDNFETPEQFSERLTRALGQMMFVSGETAEASPETTGMIEEIVRAQVIEMLKQATELANRRGVRSISTADLIFLIRHDKAKVSRLKTFLSWKDVRKNVKDSDEKGGGDAGEVDFDDGANLPGAGPVDSKKSSNKKAKLILPWEVQSFYSEQVPERDDEEDNEEEEEQNEATLARLASADERTKNMTRDEYVYWSDCRQASFTFRKGKRFREWAGFGVVTDSKPNDDIVDILGFLTFEIVQTLTEEALKVKAAEDLHNARTSGAAGGETKKRKREGSSLFEMPEEGRTPVEPKHVREAFRRLQIIPKKYCFMRPGYMGIKQPLRLV